MTTTVLHNDWGEWWRVTQQGTAVWARCPRCRRGFICPQQSYRVDKWGHMFGAAFVCPYGDCDYAFAGDPIFHLDGWRDGWFGTWERIPVVAPQGLKR
jgi:hypothetical protein